MKILITGAGGFVGGRLLEYFSLANNNVNIKVISQSIIPNLVNKNIKIYKNINWFDSISLEEVCANTDLIIHAAGMNAKDCFENPNLALKFNGVATENLLKAAIKSGVKKFLYISTTHVYSGKFEGIFDESSNTLNDHPYSTSHLYGENVILNAHKNNSIEGIIVRLSNGFGRPINLNSNCWNLLVNDVCKQAFNFKYVKLNTNEKQKRDFIAISEICNAINYLINIRFSHLENTIFNLSSGESKTILNMTQIIIQRIDKIFGYQPYLKLHQISVNENKEYLLKIDSKKLKQTGYVFRDSEIPEIDDLLMYCYLNFKKI